jgi:hypothetical protein
VTPIILAPAELRALRRVQGAERVGACVYEQTDAPHLRYLADAGLIWGAGWRWRLTPLGRAFLMRATAPANAPPPCVG